LGRERGEKKSRRGGGRGNGSRLPVKEGERVSVRTGTPFVLLNERNGVVRLRWKKKKNRRGGMKRGAEKVLQHKLRCLSKGEVDSGLRGKQLDL